MDRAAKTIAILGAGESGLGAALLAQKLGYQPYVSASAAPAPAFAKAFAEAGLHCELGHDEARLQEAAIIVKSPGIPSELPLLQRLQANGAEIISELEFAARHCRGRIIAVTGTNGKTTVTRLIYHILQRAGLDVALVGNVGLSFAASVAQGQHDYYALEVSSFQLDDVRDFAPHIAVFTNLTPDHLDRYQGDISRYAAAKFKITARQGPDDFFIYNGDDPLLAQYWPAQATAAQCLAFSLTEMPPLGAGPGSQDLILIKTPNQEQMSINELSLQGKHNRSNSMAAGLASRLLKIRKETIRDSLASFESVEHRLEPVLEIYGIQFINDSKATNVNSTWYALESMQSPTIWIAGGVDKGNDYSQLLPLVQEKVKALICLGTDVEKLRSEFDGKVATVIEAASMDEAVRMAYRLGEKGDTVLLSPACASFDLFENYEDRGRQFKNAVREL